ncbi:DUF2188 domain-containing protein [Phreatobacter sp.]|uniref:DUF2188 domain-containing protein n=1 Tax=Phreatobacter sp. TaxID=1966341 RepID=UPI0022C3AE0F|nr:DUF2188 domain-containing protein [Phreatobacter sp.]MCZ8314337.1 DUF2188 domain-containing protein [Phreatobacter sp.]
MTKVTYTIVEHDGGWAYKQGDVFSETFQSHDAALDAAKRAADAQSVPGTTEPTLYQDRRGRWHEEIVSGDDRPETNVVD